MAGGLRYFSLGFLVLGYAACGLGGVYFTYVAVRSIIDGNVGTGLILVFIGVPALLGIGATVVGMVAGALGGLGEWLRPKESPQASASRKTREHWEVLLPEGLPEGFEFGPDGWPVGPDGEPIPRDP